MYVLYTLNKYIKIYYTHNDAGTDNYYIINYYYVADLGMIKLHSLPKLKSSNFTQSDHSVELIDINSSLLSHTCVDRFLVSNDISNSLEINAKHNFIL